MKNRIFTASLIVIAIVALIATLKKAHHLAQPTELAPEKSKSFKQDRKAWMEQMHRSAPGVDWREIEYQNKKAKHKRYKKKLTSAKLKNAQNNTSEEIVPNALSGTWQEKGSNNQSGRMMVVEVDYQDSLIYAASQGGNVWQSPLDGSNWIPLNDGMNMGDIRFIEMLMADTTKRLLVQASKEMMYSDNLGQTWNTSTGIDGPQNWGSLQKSVIAQDSLQSIYTLCTEWDYTNWESITTLYRSVNHGESFNKIAQFAKSSKYFDLWTSETFASPVVLTNADTLLQVSGDTISFLSHVGSTIAEADIEKVMIAGHQSAHNLTLYAMHKSQGLSFFFASTDHGLTWTQKTSIDQGPFMNNSFHVSLLDSSKIFFGGVEAFRSYNSGNTWTKINTWGSYYADPDIRLHADIPEIESFIDPNGDEQFYISTDGGCYHSSDALTSIWNISLDGLRVSQYYHTYSKPNDPNKIYAGAQDQGFQESLSGTSSYVEFDQTISGDYGHLNSGNNGQSIWCVYPTFAMHVNTSNMNLRMYDFDGYNFLWMPPIIPDPSNADKALLAGGGTNGGAYIVKVDGTGGNLTGVQQNFDFSEGNAYESISAIAVSPLQNDNWYVCTSDGDFFYSINGGTTWTKNQTFEAPNNHYFYGNAIATSSTDPNMLFLAGSGYSNDGVYKSEDNGLSFDGIQKNLPATMVYDLALTPDDELLFAATEAGPYVYVDSLDWWFDMSGISAPDQVYWSVEYMELTQTVRFGTHGRGIWDFTIDPTTLIASNKTSTTANVYPNPFGESITLQAYELKGQDINIEIFDLAGKRVFSDIISNFDSKYVWNGTSTNGASIKPGTYFYSLSGNGTKLTGRICRL